jgi:hypothetical protein
VIWRASLIPVTLTGVHESVVVPFPNWPETPYPQQLIVPPERSAHTWPPPAVICVASLIPLTPTGVHETNVAPFPR